MEMNGPAKDPSTTKRTRSFKRLQEEEARIGTRSASNSPSRLVFLFILKVLHFISY